jgi:hypothetical protein
MGTCINLLRFIFKTGRFCAVDRILSCVTAFQWQQPPQGTGTNGTKATRHCSLVQIEGNMGLGRVAVAFKIGGPVIVELKAEVTF